MRILVTGIDLVMAFHADLDKPDCARGTRHVIDLALPAGIPTLTFASQTTPAIGLHERCVVLAAA